MIGFSTCKFDSPAAVQFLRELEGGKRRWTKSYSTVLSAEPFCRLIPQPVGAIGKCSYKSADVQQNCLARRAVVAKVIRLADISRLEPVHEHSIIDHHGTSHLPAALHVLHLVRDPRGTLHSRLKIGQVKQEYLSLHANTLNVKAAEMLQFSAYRLCNQIRHTIAIGESNVPWLQGRYLRVRFEDIALDPAVQMTQLFHRYGLEMTANVLQWIKNNTNGTASYDRHRNAMDTNRNSTSVISSWKAMLQSETGRQRVKIIEDQCRDVIGQLGYELVT